jgi:hypothetical protein
MVSRSERRPLDPQYLVGEYLIQLDRRLACPQCNQAVRRTDAREIKDGFALTCPRCHIDLVIVED